MTISVASLLFSLHCPAEPNRVCFRSITAHYDDNIGIFDINPVVGHTATKCWSRLATVGPCQTRAWLSTASIPSDLANFCVNIPVSLLAADATASLLITNGLLLFLPFFSMKFASRSSFIKRAMRVKASSQLMFPFIRAWCSIFRIT